MGSQNDRWFKPAVIILGILIVLGLFGNIYLLLRKEKLNKSRPMLNDRCSAAKSVGDCIKMGCVFVDVGSSNDPQVRNSPWCVSSASK